MAQTTQLKRLISCQLNTFTIQQPFLALSYLISQQQLTKLTKTIPLECFLSSAIKIIDLISLLLYWSASQQSFLSSHPLEPLSFGVLQGSILTPYSSFSVSPNNYISKNLSTTIQFNLLPPYNTSNSFAIEGLISTPN